MLGVIMRTLTEKPNYMPHQTAQPVEKVFVELDKRGR